MPRMKAGRPRRTLDPRVTRIEQILPTLATKDDLERFATKGDLERFATKRDLERFATKKDLKRFATKQDLKLFYDRLHRQMMVLHEAIIARLDQHLEVYAHHEERLSEHRVRLDNQDARLGDHELRLTAVERSRPAGSGPEP